jgi:hypothetical protein
MTPSAKRMKVWQQWVCGVGSLIALYLIVVWTDGNAAAFGILRFFGALGIGAFALQHIVVHVLQADLARYKSELELERDQFKNNLEQKAIQHFHTWRVLQEQRAKKIGEIHVAMIDFLGASENFTMAYGSGSAKSARGEKVRSAFTQFMATWLRNRIYLSKALSDRIGELGKLAFGPMAHYAAIEEGYKDAMEFGQNRQKVEESLQTARNVLINDAQPIADDIEEEFRAILGVPK